MKNVIVFGIGKNTEKVLEQKLIALSEVKYFFVTSNAIGQSEFFDRPLYFLIEVVEIYDDENVVIISESFEQIFNNLVLLNFKPEKLFALIQNAQTNPVISNLAYPTKPKYLNVGGGHYFYYDKWLNLEGADSYLHPFQLSAKCTFPVTDESIELVYSSHCLEHLDVFTLAQIMRETNRCLKTNGKLLLKLPDFDSVYQEWKGTLVGPSVLGIGWSFESLIDIWKKYGVESSIESRALFILTGIDLNASPDLFEKNVSFETADYVGPVILDQAELQQVRNCSGPGNTARLLVDIAKEKFPAARLIHQNAWTKEEFIEYAESFGFKLLNDNKNIIIEKYHWIPQISKIDNLSNYFLFEC
ncbi:methyltransferase domain-containing protein [Aliiglaciecola sp. NS0011-25]|uniref:methyltransferase domain-containing protein n=1 Tax=Aliiglaciecola sp. NS0011-25 TaxID=3127654 RepID=UPI0031049501